ncbi:MAG: SDR family oxidoreductase [Pseudomonadales bacterium]|jgi:NAD(P)-dependent dehydrogenase (short-subunit alcohol dehydrogenase family)|nr:SDR family oxidoreductase [Pseudomonadales bacterium]MDP6473224.1 SDR family oxidoreductase [Pseudomonadales bacterium]MDP6826015.1 SDR family oxidoreductase [Pseudomonadales bacterium]MDP6970755.1 SDR family oxidoreductase [Pseudomonadales bacterium]|tara:strand:+ start:1155 stop:2015 length:861 start_codon:yes stop_codon:yes gene_type:complete
MSDPLLRDKVALVSAAGRGIGRGIALELARAGAKVAVNSYSEDTTAGTASAVEEQGTEALAFPDDITQPDVILAMVQETLERFGRIDILVNNVGAGPKTGMQPEAGPLGPVAMLWDALYAQNLKPAVLMTEAVVPHFREQGGGKVINISSIAGRASLSDRMLTHFVPPAYGAMKAALAHYTQTMAETLGPHNINVNAVCPGIVYTDAWAGNAERAVRTIPDFQGMDAREWFEGIFTNAYPEYFHPTPMRREQTIEDIGNAVVFLVSNHAMNITGQSLMVDGGMVKL